MALSKPIEQENGVVTNYHRILFVTHTINSHISIAVLSYVDETQRQKEIESNEYRPYRMSITYELPYRESFSIEEAYSYLKTLSEFENAMDV